MEKQEQSEPEEKVHLGVPILPLRDTVIFPNSILPLAVGRDSTVRLLKENSENTEFIGVVAQRDASIESPGAGDLYEMGSGVKIHKSVRMPDGSIRLVVQGVFRFRLLKVVQESPYIRADVEVLPDVAPAEDAIEIDALMRSKAAMYSILTTLTNQVGVAFADLHRIYVAGAFGKHISPRQAIVLGMLPDLEIDTYEPLGNSSLAGAKLILLDKEARKRSLQVVTKVTYVELNVNQEFMIRFSGSRFIPHTDHTLFPSVPFFEEP